MRPVEAIVLIDRLEKTNQQLIALAPDDYAGSGLKVYKKLVDEEKNIIFYYVDRLEFINLLKTEHKLRPRGGTNAVRRNK